MAAIKKCAKRLRIYIGETDHYDRIVKKAKELDMAGVTVFRGIMGYGENNRQIRSARLVELSCDLPIVIEIVDVEEKIKLLLPYLEKMVDEGMITMEYVTILMYRHE